MTTPLLLAGRIERGPITDPRLPPFLARRPPLFDPALVWAVWYDALRWRAVGCAPPRDLVTWLRLYADTPPTCLL